MRLSVAVTFLVAAALVGPAATAAITIKDRTINEPLVLDQNEDYFLHKVYISGITDLAALTLTGKINSVNLSHCVFSNIMAGINGKAVAAESQGAIVNSFVATDTAFEDAQHQLLCLREGAFGTVTFQRCKFRTTDSFLKKIYADDPWRTTPPITEFANIERLELLDNEYVNTILVVHPSVKVVVFRGDISSVRLQSPGTHVIRLEKGQDPATIQFDGTAVADLAPAPPQEQDEQAATPAPDTKPQPAAATAEAANDDVATVEDPSLYQTTSTVSPAPKDLVSAKPNEHP